MENSASDSESEYSGDRRGAAFSDSPTLDSVGRMTRKGASLGKETGVDSPNSTDGDGGGKQPPRAAAASPHLRHDDTSETPTVTAVAAVQKGLKSPPEESEAKNSVRSAHSVPQPATASMVAADLASQLKATPAIQDDMSIFDAVPGTNQPIAGMNTSWWKPDAVEGIGGSHVPSTAHLPAEGLAFFPGGTLDIPLPAPFPNQSIEPHREGVPGAYFVAGVQRSPVQRTVLSQARPGGASRNRPQTISSIEFRTLSVADEISDESEASLVHAEAVDSAQLERRRVETKNKKTKLFLMGVLLVTLVLAAILAALFGRPSKENTASPSSAQSQGPSSAPSAVKDLFLQALPDYTLESLMKYGTPQWNAQDWLFGHPELPNLPEWRKVQLFALASFYYAMGGPHWPKAMRDDWLQYERNECFWFSSEFGEFVGGSRGWDESIYYNITPCNVQGEFQMLYLTDLELAPHKPHVPPEISLLKSLSIFALPSNDINASVADILPSEIYQLNSLRVINLQYNLLWGSLPSELGLLSTLIDLLLNENALRGSVPTELGFMTSLTRMLLWGNGCLGEIPSQVGLMSNMLYMQMGFNHLTGTMPTEFGMMTNMEYFSFRKNELRGLLPKELGFMTSLTELKLNGNDFSGRIPSQYGWMSNMLDLDLGYNALMGSIPTELGLLTNLQFLKLGNNSLTGGIPSQFDQLAINGSLSLASFVNNSLSGTITDALCSLGAYNEMVLLGMSSDCGEKSCGCCWCVCPSSNATTNCTADHISTYDPAEDEDWPGIFPAPVNSKNLVTINFRTDEFPQETKFEWSMRDGVWKVLESNNNLRTSSHIYSYTTQVESDALYRLHVFDRFDDGTCCAYGYGWFTITNSTPSDAYAQGTVIFTALGSFGSLLEVLVWIDSNGQSQLVQYIPGKGYALVLDEPAWKEEVIVVSDVVDLTNSSEVLEEPQVP